MHFDIYTIIAIIVTIIVIFQLRGVLGKRTGNERPPFDPYSSRGESKVEKTESAKDGNVVSLPKRASQRETALNPHLEEDNSITAVIDRLAETGSPLNEGLRKIVAVAPDFEPEHFLAGASAAYEYIVTAFAAGDRKTLESLLSDDVYEGFDSAISAREQKKETIDFSFVGINKARIINAELIGKMARIQVNFKSELIQAIMDSDGRVVEGDPNAVNEVTDIWTFERNTSSKDPNWKLVATETPD